jgi:hypothetical protein
LFSIFKKKKNWEAAENVRSWALDFSGDMYLLTCRLFFFSTHKTNPIVTLLEQIMEKGIDNGEIKKGSIKVCRPLKLIMEAPSSMIYIIK